MLGDLRSVENSGQPISLQLGIIYRLLLVIIDHTKAIREGQFFRMTAALKVGIAVTVARLGDSGNFFETYYLTKEAKRFGEF